jgi:hypothetical protein
LISPRDAALYFSSGRIIFHSAELKGDFHLFFPLPAFSNPLLQAWIGQMLIHSFQSCFGVFPIAAFLKFAAG